MSDNVLPGIFESHRAAVMGILNVTPDSFSDGGAHYDPDVAVARGLAMAAAGVEVLDVGGESTRPGSAGVSADEELRRVLPVIEGLLDTRPDLVVSIDTSKTDVARRALASGARLLNDVTAGADDGMLEVAAESGAAVVLMHMRGSPRTMQKDTRYDDVVTEVRDYLVERARVAEAAGVTKDRIVLDPGIGFGKDVEGNLALVRGLGRLAEPGYPVLLGTSRKSFLGLLTGASERSRLGATLASVLPAFELARVILRVHDAEEMVRFRTVWEAIYSAD